MQHLIATRILRLGANWHVHPEVDRLTAIYCFLLSQCMQHNPREQSHVTGENLVGRKRNWTRADRAQNSNVLDMSIWPMG